MRIKTIATLGPSSNDYNILKSMVEYGVRIFRLNFSHGDPKSFLPVIQLVKALEEEISLPLTIMGDLSGPKIRIEKIDNSPWQVTKGETIYLGLPEYKSNFAKDKYIGLDLPQVMEGLKEGMLVTFSDGIPQFKITKVLHKDRLFVLIALSSGIISSFKGISFPGKYIDLPALTEKDKHDLHAGLEIGVDSFALSFVQNQEDIRDIKKEIKDHGKDYIPVIAKLERADGINNLESILELADGIMVARGDLGLECPLSSLPILQKKIIRACMEVQKPSIVATQMLLSMVKNALPTRAEVTDVANAILDGADCLMLSEETAVGNYPIEVVKFIQDIAEHAESYYLSGSQVPHKPKVEKDLGKYLAYSACLLADNTDSAALVCHSTTGLTASLLSSCRPAQPIFALTPHMSTIRKLNFYWGIKPRLSDPKILNHLERAEQFIQTSSHFQEGDKIVITSGQPTPGQLERHTNQIKIYYK